MLLLFDIDATLIKTSGLGIKAMGLAGRELFGDSFNERCVEYAGRLDPLIITDLLRAHAIDETPAIAAAFREGYKKYLRVVLSEPGKAITCPGVPALLQRLAGHPAVTLGLLTGNFPDTGEVKLRACDIDPSVFAISAWGNDSPHSPPARDHLPPVAMMRFHERFGRRVDPRKITIIGDTPHDIGCAKAHGCRSLGVGTGQFTAEALAACGASHAVPDMSDTDAVTEWLVNA